LLRFARNDGGKGQVARFKMQVAGFKWRNEEILHFVQNDREAIRLTGRLGDCFVILLLKDFLAVTGGFV